MRGNEDKFKNLRQTYNILRRIYLKELWVNSNTLENSKEPPTWNLSNGQISKPEKRTP